MTAAKAPTPIIGIGLYSISEAARLLRVDPRTIGRWMRGYTYRRSGERRNVGPLWRADVQGIDDDVQLSFHDLIELRFVNAFVEKGISLLAVRAAYVYAKDCLNTNRPFLTGKFRTDGKTIFLEGIERSGEESLLDLRSKQYVFKKVVEQQFKDLDLERENVVRWRPFHGKKSIVIDPERSFGVPIAEETGVPTAALVSSFEAEGSLRRVAAIFEVSQQVVRDALRYHQELAVA